MDNQETAETKKREMDSTTASAPLPKKRKRKKGGDPAALELRQTINLSCKDNDLARALKAYDEAVEKGTRIEAVVYYRLLALCDGLEKKDALHIGKPKSTPTNPATPSSDKVDKDNKDKKTENHQNTDTIPKRDQGPDQSKQTEEISLEDRKRHAFRIKAAMDKAKIPLTEAAYTPVIKLLAKTGDIEQANEIVLESEKVQQCKPALRLYASLLQAYAEAGKAVDAVRIWSHLTQQKIMPSEKEYLMLLRCAVTCQSSTLMEAVLTELAEYVPVPSRDTIQAIIDWFESSVAYTASKEQPNEADLKAMLDKARTPVDGSMRVVSPTMGPVLSSTGWTISTDCLIDTSNGIMKNGCLQGDTLQKVEIAPETWQDMQKANETIVLSGQLQEHNSAYQGGGKGSKRIPNDRKQREFHWNHFRGYLDQRETPIDVVIDGANVGFFEQNFADAPSHVSFEQIDWVIEALRDRGNSVLLVMHSRHFQRGKVPRKFEPLVDKWIKQDILYRTPPGMNDDWFWMHVALVRPGTLVLTNDEMRDHHFQMLAPRCFLRWKDLHQVHFEFSDWVPKQEGDPRRRTVNLTFPNPYTRKVQRIAGGLVVPLPKRGDENRFLDGCFVAEDDAPESETYLCIRPTN